jgi:hypothetical protein
MNGEEGFVALFGMMQSFAALFVSVASGKPCFTVFGNADPLVRLGLGPLTFCSLLSPGEVLSSVTPGLLMLDKEASRLLGNIACLAIGCLGDIVKLVDCGSYLEVLSFGCSGPKGTKLLSMVASGHPSSCGVRSRLVSLTTGGLRGKNCLVGGSNLKNSGAQMRFLLGGRMTSLSGS